MEHFVQRQEHSLPAAPLGSLANDIDVKFTVPVVVHPCEWWALLVREFNTAAGGLVQTTVDIDGYWE